MKTFTFAAAAATFLLTACGGGGGDAAAPPMALGSLQGFWNGPITGATLGGANKARAVVLENGAAWIFLHDDSMPSEPLIGLATATLAVSANGFTGTGKRYPASGASVGSMALVGNEPSADALGITVTADASPASALSLSYDPRYDVAAVQADAVGTWRFTKAGGSIEVAWVVAGSGVLSGTSTLGCTYSGLVVPHGAAAAVFDVTVAETCTGVDNRLAGIAKLNSDRSFLTFGLTTSDGAYAEAFAAARR